MLTKTVQTTARFEPEIPFIGICLRIKVFAIKIITALFKIVENNTLPKCPTTEESNKLGNAITNSYHLQSAYNETGITIAAELANRTHS